MGAASTLAVHTTKDFALAKKLRVILASSSGPRGTSTKMVEVPGPALYSGIAVNNPFLPEDCRRHDCPQVASGEPCLGRCARESVLYQAICTKCDTVNDEGKEVISQHIRETSRTLHIRRKQHLADFRNCSEGNKDNIASTNRDRIEES